jgi:hypothetical protein
VSYRVELHASALAQIQGIPSEAFDALVSRLADVVDKPWDAFPLQADEPEFRQVIFGGQGLASFYVDERNEVLRVFDITWVG